MQAAGVALSPDSLRAILDSVFAGGAYQWVERPDPWAPVRRAWLSLLDWLARLERENPGAYKLLLWALIAILGVILIHGLVVLWRMARSSVAEGEAAAPLPPPRDARWYRAEAERLAAAGEYRRAMQAEFTAVVLTLDERRLLRFHPSKTPGEYAAERRELSGLVRTLYAHVFARVPCGPEEYGAWRLLAAGAADAT